MPLTLDVTGNGWRQTPGSGSSLEPLAMSQECGAGLMNCHILQSQSFHGRPESLQVRIDELVSSHGGIINIQNKADGRLRQAVRNWIVLTRHVLNVSRKLQYYGVLPLLQLPTMARGLCHAECQGLVVAKRSEPATLQQEHKMTHNKEKGEKLPIKRTILPLTVLLKRARGFHAPAIHCSQTAPTA